jgi:hypothetical protein
MQHPKDFSGAGLLNGSWIGPFRKLMDISGRPAEQIPFFVSMYAPDEALMKETVNQAYRLTAKGYLVYLEKFEKNEKIDAVDLKTRMIDWLQKKAEAWTYALAKNKKTKKEKMSIWLREFFSAPAHH